MNQTPHGYEILGGQETDDYTYVFIQPLNTGVDTIFAAVLCEGKTALTFPVEEGKDLTTYPNNDDHSCMFCDSTTDIITAKGLYPVPQQKHKIVPYNQSEEVWIYFCEQCWLKIYNQLDITESSDVSTIISRKL